MANNDYNHELFVAQLAAHMRSLDHTNNRVIDLHRTLAAPMPDQYDIDHAAERLGWAAKSLRESADLLDSLAKYARH